MGLSVSFTGQMGATNVLAKLTKPLVASETTAPMSCQDIGLLGKLNLNEYVEHRATLVESVTGAYRFREDRPGSDGPL